MRCADLPCALIQFTIIDAPQHLCGLTLASCVVIRPAASLRDPDGVLAPYKNDAKPQFLLFFDGELTKHINGINMPVLKSAIASQIPEGTFEDDAPDVTEGDPAG